MQEGQQTSRGSDASPKSDTNASQTTDIQIRKPSTSDVLPYGLALLPCIRQQKAGARVQERALRAVYCNRTAPYEKLLKTAGQPTLQNRRLQDIAILMCKVKNNLIPRYIQDLFCKNNSSYNLRNADFIIPRFNTVLYGKHSLKYLGPKLWSTLDAKVRSLPNLHSFRKCIRQCNITELLSEACSNCFLCSNLNNLS